MAVKTTDVIFLCLPTPQDEDGSADLKYVFGIVKRSERSLHNSGDKDF
jgi:UDPglucose 6-dehydrogenase